jgi:3-dehydroquinate synthase
MKTRIIHGSAKDSTILVGESIRNLSDYLPDCPVIIIADEKVYSLYKKEFPPAKIIPVQTGEKLKTLDTVKQILNELVKMEADRTTFLLGIGGGILCDIAGFVASIYMRGVRFGFVSTTLLSQVDASVGGKNGVNFEGYKNMVGVFNQPDFVICDPDLLKTLPEKEFLNGCAEIVKHALIADHDLFRFLEENYEGIYNLDRKVIERVVYDSVIIKSDVVDRDEKEKGERRKLNFGHTIGHAIEKVTGTTHGEAVGMGMAAAVKLSESKGLLSQEESNGVVTLLKNMKLTTEIHADREQLLDAVKRDKKREGESIHFVLLEGIGRAVIQEISIKELQEFIL